MTSERTPDPEETDLETVGHPRGTLAIIVLYGLLFALGWLGIFFFEFMPRGLPHP